MFNLVSMSEARPVLSKRRDISTLLLHNRIGGAQAVAILYKEEEFEFWAWCWLEKRAVDYYKSIME